MDIKGLLGFANVEPDDNFEVVTARRQHLVNVHTPFWCAYPLGSLSGVDGRATAMCGAAAAADGVDAGFTCPLPYVSMLCAERATAEDVRTKLQQDFEFPEKYRNEASASSANKLVSASRSTNAANMK